MPLRDIEPCESTYAYVWVNDGSNSTASTLLCYSGDFTDSDLAEHVADISHGNAISTLAGSSTRCYYATLRATWLSLFY